jgi:hypothetical protein
VKKYEIERLQSLFKNRLLKTIKKETFFYKFFQKTPSLNCRGCDEILNENSNNQDCHNILECSNGQKGNLIKKPKSLFSATKRLKIISSSSFALSLVLLLGGGISDISGISKASLFNGGSENILSVIDPFFLFLGIFFLIFSGALFFYMKLKLEHSQEKGFFKRFIHNEDLHPIYFSSKN